METEHRPARVTRAGQTESLPSEVVLVGMAGSGNLGDDLISSILVNLIRARFSSAAVTVLCGGEPNPFGYPGGGVETVVGGLGTRRGLRDAELRKRVRSANLLAIGGGGLLQDTHNIATPWKWLRYMNWVDRRSCVMWGLGLGIGPLRHWLTRVYLRSALPSFDSLQVRDGYSEHLATELGGLPTLSSDVVVGSDVHAFGFSPRRAPDDCLGCSLRPWPGLSVGDASAAIKQTADNVGITRIRLFTFEWYATNVGELRFQEQVARSLMDSGYDCELFCYGRDPIATFVDSFVHVRFALAMRLHANILWLKVGVPVRPISYAPKVRSVFGSGDDGKWSSLGSVKVAADFQTKLRFPAYSLPATYERKSTLRPAPAFDSLFETARTVRQFARMIGIRE